MLSREYGSLVNCPVGRLFRGKAVALLEICKLVCSRPNARSDYDISFEAITKLVGELLTVGRGAVGGMKYVE
jgi:hypothetical protein